MIPWHQHLLLRNSKDLVPEKLLEMKDVFQVLKKYFFSLLHTIKYPAIIFQTSHK